MMATMVCSRSALTFVLLAAVAGVHAQQYEVRIVEPVYSGDEGPLVLWDVAHHNAHRWGMEAFLEVLHQDGYRVNFQDEPFSAATLRDARVLVLPGPLAVPRDRLLRQGLDHYWWSDEGREQALSESEVLAVTAWIRAGGALLLILDHAPAPAAVSWLLEALGVDARNSMTWDGNRQPPEYEDLGSRRTSKILFGRDWGSLGEHPIVEGRHPGERVNRVATYVGASLVGPLGSTPLLLLSPDAFDYWKVPPTRGGNEHRLPAHGRSQATAFTLGEGRVVVVAEYTVFQARWNVPGDPDGTIGAGMAYAGADNQQFAANIVRWLAGMLP